MPDLTELIKHDVGEIECRQSAIDVGKPIIRFSENTDVVLVRASPINSVSRKCVLPILRT